MIKLFGKFQGCMLDSFGVIGKKPPEHSNLTGAIADEVC